MYPYELKLVGKLGNYVHYYVKGKKHVRSYVIPVQPGTSAQQTRWTLFANGVSAWQALTPIQKAGWDDQARPLKMSGFNLFMRVYLT
jgi:hypothetical protein